MAVHELAEIVLNIKRNTVKHYFSLDYIENVSKQDTYNYSVIEFNVKTLSASDLQLFPVFPCRSLTGHIESAVCAAQKLWREQHLMELDKLKS